jgi:hypothetical protein
MKLLQQSLVGENRIDLQNRIDIACKNSEEYKLLIASLLAHSASLEHTGKPETHPIITLNALKNILSENPSKPSREILTAMVNILSGKPVRKNKYQDLLRDLKVDGVSGSVFFMDLEDALQRGEHDQALKEAARLYTVSDNPICVLECVAELALQSIQELGQFIFHLMRAAAFNPTHDNTWLFICCAIKEITKNNLPDPHVSDPIEIEPLIPYVLRQSNPKLLVDFSVMKRLWNREYLRSKAFIREISYWLSTLKLNDSEIDHSKTKFTATSDSDEDLTKLQEIQFIKLVEDILTRLLGDHILKLREKILMIDALRYFVKSDRNPNLSPIIRERIQEIVKR